MIGRLHSVVIDCPDPPSLAAFYGQLLGMWVMRNEGDDWVVIGNDDEPGRIAFQRAPDLQPPRWPDLERPQQFHLDVMVKDVAAAERKALAIGATRLPGEGEDFRVYADPVGHPFCLVWET